ncbi:MAG: prepilin-type N-terminal cleavage/methylation domain-containing protein [Candidatus Omnitrophica bacterium]|nr:prepilin-type N-terminal cleavage/methylation domain-containing protein [Candidatus Omnitrophota bacterium]
MADFKDSFQRRGFTLVETIIVIVILSVIMFSVMYFMTEGFRIWVQNRNYIELRADGRYALSRMAAEIKLAEDLIPGATNQEISFHADVDYDGYPQLIMYEKKVTSEGSFLVRGEETINPSGWRAWPLCDNVYLSMFSIVPVEGRVIITLVLKKGNEEVKYITDLFTRRIDAW